MYSGIDATATWRIVSIETKSLERCYNGYHQVLRMLIYYIPGPTALDSECIFTHKNRVVHIIFVIHHPQPFAIFSFCWTVIWKIVHYRCSGYDILTRCFGWNNHTSRAISLERLRNYLPTAAIMAYWLNGVRTLRGWLAFVSNVGFRFRVSQKLLSRRRNAVIFGYVDNITWLISTCVSNSLVYGQPRLKGMSHCSSVVNRAQLGLSLRNVTSQWMTATFIPERERPWVFGVWQFRVFFLKRNYAM
jgi:hypothetical protein